MTDEDVTDLNYSSTTTWSPFPYKGRQISRIFGCGAYHAFERFSVNLQVLPAFCPEGLVHTTSLAGGYD
ncbi:MAG: hypothetical protein IKB41_04265 [Clostridia bacterium]|nr:hypothetical protein [Clostridia bacterium]